MAAERTRSTRFARGLCLTLSLGMTSACGDDDTSAQGNEAAESSGADTLMDTTSESTSESGSDAETTAESESESETTTTTTDDTTSTGGFDLDAELWALLDEQDPPVTPLSPPPADPPELVALGEALFFDPILSGNKDTACASCHHPAFAGGDALSLSVGTGATGLGPERASAGHPDFIARHAQSLFNVGDPSMTRMFWDGRVEALEGGELITPAQDDLLEGVADALAAQAMFPVLDRTEMRGQPGDMTIEGDPNELAGMDDADEPAIWAALTQRVVAIDAYTPLLSAAFPDLTSDQLTFAQLANAIGAYQRQAFATSPAPWDGYLEGDNLAISDGAKLGAILFYSSGGCAKCHSGPLLTDNDFHSTGVVQLGPGQVEEAPYDFGRERVSGDALDRYAFKTPSLRNVEFSAPYMHDGAYSELGEALVHYVDPTTAAADFDSSLLLAELQPTVQSDPGYLDALVASLSPELELDGISAGLPNIRSFLESLSDPNYEAFTNSAPDSVPSGLPLP